MESSCDFSQVQHSLRRKAGEVSGGFAEPGDVDGDDEFDLLVGQRTSGGDAVPFGEAAAAAGRGRVLRDEDGVAAHGRLVSVIARRRGREPFADNLAGVPGNRLPAIAGDKGTVRFRKPET